MAAVRHLGFVKFEIFNGQMVKRTFCISIPNFVKIGQTIAEISRFLLFFNMAAAAILDYQKLKILTVDPVPGANVRLRAKFHQDRWNGRRYMVI